MLNLWKNLQLLRTFSFKVFGTTDDRNGPLAKLKQYLSVINDLEEPSGGKLIFKVDEFLKLLLKIKENN